MTKASPATFKKDQAKKLASMTAETQKIATFISDKIAGETVTRMKTWYAIGKSIEKALNENKVETYGANVAQQLADYLPGFQGNRNKIYQLRDMVTVFELSFIEAKSALRVSSNDEPFLTLSHWMALAKVTDEKTRLKLVNTVIEEGHSVRELQEQIRTGENFKSRSEGAGRPMSVPRTPMAALNLGSNMFTKLSNTLNVVTTHGLCKLDDAPSEEVAQEHLQAVIKQRETVEAAIKALTEYQSHLEALQPTVEEKLRAQAEAAEAASNDVEADEQPESGEQSADATAEEPVDESVEEPVEEPVDESQAEPEPEPAPAPAPAPSRKPAAKPPAVVVKQNARATVVTAKPTRPPMIGKHGRPTPAGV